MRKGKGAYEVEVENVCLFLILSLGTYCPPAPPFMPFLCQSVHMKIAKIHLKTFYLARANIHWVLTVCQALRVLFCLIFKIEFDGCSHICITEEDMRHKEVAESHLNPWLWFWNLCPSLLQSFTGPALSHLTTPIPHPFNTMLKTTNHSYAHMTLKIPFTYFVLVNIGFPDKY